MIRQSIYELGYPGKVQFWMTTFSPFFPSRSLVGSFRDPGYASTITTFRRLKDPSDILTVFCAYDPKKMTRLRSFSGHRALDVSKCVYTSSASSEEQEIECNAVLRN